MNDIIRCVRKYLAIFHSEICYNNSEIDIQAVIKREKILLIKLLIIRSLYNKRKLEMFLRRKQTVITEEKSIKRLEQEKIVNNWKIKLKKVSIPTLENALSDLEKKMNQYSLIEFDEDIQNIARLIETLPHKENLLFNYNMGYKFSKSSEEFTQYFSECHFANYSEMSYVETKNDEGLSFTANKKCLLYCAVYGDQLTQIPFNIEHPYYEKLKDANIEYDGGVFEAYHSNILLTGKNINVI